MHSGGTAGNIVLKLDGEPAILALREALAKYHGGIVQEGPAACESQSNGLVEEAGKTVKEFVRELKEQIEGKTNVKLKSDGMIRWAVMMVSKYMVGTHGRATYERRRNRAPVATFAQKESKDKIESEWHEGLRLQQSRSTNETIVVTAEGVVRA